MTPLPEPPACVRCGASVFDGKRGDVCPACQATQQQLTARCPRCSGALHDDHELGELAAAALDTLRRRNRTDSAAAVLQLVRNEMRCRVGVCGVKR